MGAPGSGAHGGVLGVGVDADVPVHYGQLVLEQRALAERRGIVDLSQLEIVRLRGAERLTWLGVLCSAAVADLAPGASAEALLLDAEGRVAHAFALIDTGEVSLLIADGGAGAALADFLTSMVFRAKVEVEVAGELSCIGFCGPVPPALGGEVIWRDPWPGVVDGGTRYGAASEEHPGKNWDFSFAIGSRDAMGLRMDEAFAQGWARCGMWALEALRIEAWRPRPAREAAGPALPHELDWLRTAVHLRKGCYRGQESVAKVFNVGHPPRRLVCLHLDGSGHELPEVGAAIVLGEALARLGSDKVPRAGDVLGHITSVALHYELGPVALALVRRRLDESMRLIVVGPSGGTIAASQEIIVPVSGEAADRPVFVRPPIRRLPRAGR